MSVSKTLKEQLVQELDKLPEYRLQEVLDFVDSLLSKELQRRATEPMADLDPTKDPILTFIGGVAHGALAKDIDNRLYPCR
jgi:hypothetical protein